jgi:hypothetical protein
VLGSFENRLWRRTERFKPSADVNLGVGFAAEMAGGGAIGGGQIPFDDCEFLISTLDYKPMNRIRTDDPANLALEFFQARHAFSGNRKTSIAEEYFGDALNIKMTAGAPSFPRTCGSAGHHGPQSLGLWI